ncbi:DUF4037 domain-containing protein [Nonomuraea recticatena]|uniref:DUF4037 domain-containing protein n=1 Tax=Nonomuraea recticatena TaxID=46178 RepID=UPI00361237CF
MMSGFVPGLELSRAYYADVVAPLVADIPHSAALIGPGSEVLAFDTQRSADHDWGPRVLLFVPPGAAAETEAAVEAGLPSIFCGYPTVFAQHGQVRHGVRVAELGGWLTSRLGFDPRGPITPLDWLSAPWQALAEVTCGEVFHDGLGELNRVRAALRWYPDDLWRYVLACQWQRIGQEESFPGRCAEVGDELGSATLGGRLVREVMRLALLQRRRYPPTPSGSAARWPACRAPPSSARPWGRRWPPAPGGIARRLSAPPTNGWPPCTTGSRSPAPSRRRCGPSMTGPSR